MYIKDLTCKGMHTCNVSVDYSNCESPLHHTVGSNFVWECQHWIKQLMGVPILWLVQSPLHPGIFGSLSLPNCNRPHTAQIRAVQHLDTENVLNFIWLRCNYQRLQVMIRYQAALYKHSHSAGDKDTRSYTDVNTVQLNVPLASLFQSFKL